MLNKPIIYLASPYSHPFRIVRWWRARQIKNIMARCINQQDAVIPFTPIVLTHPIAALCPDVDWVEDYDKHLLLRFSGMIVVMMPGWRDSIGIKKEVDFCLKHGIPYTHATPENIVETCRNIGRIL